MKCTCPPTAGKRYRWTVAVQSPSGTADSAGHVDLTSSSNWASQGNIRANFLSKGGRERQVFDRVEADVTHVLETPSTTLSRSIQPTWRLTFDSRTFNVTAAYDVDEMRQVVQIHVTEDK